jgi:flagellar biosynthesis/type III secretory pathway chaperone
MMAPPPPPENPAPLQELSLYRELLACLEKEWQALVDSEEEAILALAAEKERLLEKILSLTRSRDRQNPEKEAEGLRHLKRQVAEAQARNHRLITTTLETIQDFLDCLQSSPPGIYQAAGKVGTTPGNSFFHRQA